MHKKVLISLLGSALLFGFGCDANDDGTTGANSGDEGGSSGDDSGTPTSETASGSTGSDSNTTDPTETETSADTTESDTDPNPTGIGFITDPDGGGVSIECSVWDQDCDEGEKCSAWANDGGNSWNATKCVPLSGTPAQAGDPCTVEGSGVSGVDTCDVSSMCWDVDPQTNEGTCVAFCTGSENAPVCNDPTASCSIANEGVLILCLPSCDPLIQNCAEGQACYPIDNAFVCAPDASGEEQGADNDACEFLNACDAGNICVNPEIVDGCPSGSNGCCQNVCDLTATPADQGCAGSETCTPWFEEGSVPPGYEDVGVCALPV